MPRFRVRIHSKTERGHVDVDAPNKTDAEWEAKKAASEQTRKPIIDWNVDSVKQIRK